MNSERRLGEGSASRRRVLTAAVWATPGVMLAAAAPAQAASPENSPGTMRFYTATIDQDQINADLSIRINTVGSLSPGTRWCTRRPCRW